MLEFKNKDGKIVMKESTESGKVSMLTEKLKKEGIDIPEEVEELEEADKDAKSKE